VGVPRPTHDGRGSGWIVGRRGQVAEQDLGQQPVPADAAALQDGVGCDSRPAGARDPSVNPDGLAHAVIGQYLEVERAVLGITLTCSARSDTSHWTAFSTCLRRSLIVLKWHPRDQWGSAATAPNFAAPTGLPNGVPRPGRVSLKNRALSSA
jgi:hypothetical protein